jgi:hypothetical protein
MIIIKQFYFQANQNARDCVWIWTCLLLFRLTRMCVLSMVSNSCDKVKAKVAIKILTNELLLSFSDGVYCCALTLNSFCNLQNFLLKRWEKLKLAKLIKKQLCQREKKWVIDFINLHLPAHHKLSVFEIIKHSQRAL